MRVCFCSQKVMLTWTGAPLFCKLSLWIRCLRAAHSLRAFTTPAAEEKNGKEVGLLEAEPKQKSGSLLQCTADRAGDASAVECVRRNRILRSYILKRNWDCDLEFKVIQSLLAIPTPSFWLPFHMRYPLVYDFEWETFHCDSGLGDLILTDGLGSFLIVEAKTLFTFGHGSKRCQSANRGFKRRAVKQQCLRNAQIWHSRNPNVKRTEGVVVTEEGTKHVALLVRD